MGIDQASAELKCQWCGGDKHAGLQCPQVKAFDFDLGGNIRRVEFLTKADFPQLPAEDERQEYPRKGPST